MAKPSKWIYKTLGVKWDRPPGVLKRDFQKAQMEAMAEYVALWEKDALPKHFTVKGGREYGYQRRSVKYNQRKERDRKSASYGRPQDVRPLVFTGNVERIAKNSVEGKTSAKRLTIELKGMPRYLFQYKPGAPNKAREITAFSIRDGKKMQKFVESIIGDKFEKHNHAPEVVKS